MSVILRGMEMPKTCNDCGLRDSFDCWITDSYIEARFSKRNEDCPLVEIPTPHGRLGDLDALYEEISNGNKAYNGIEGYDGEYQNIGDVDDCLDVIKMEDTVIEAEGSET